MSPTRRDFIKFIVAGSVAAGCPLNLPLLAESLEKKPLVDGEQSEVCHRLRDGHKFDRPPASERYDVVIVGGGVSGLAAAYLLQKFNFLLLEKELHWGGNAYLESYEGQAFATGSAFEEFGTPGAELAKEIGLELLPVNNPDATIVQGEFVADTWGEGLDRLPYPAGVRASFKKFRGDVLAMPLEQRRRQLDNQPFSDFFRGYAPEVKQWWDAYGPSNWGARTEDTSAMVGIEEVQSIASEDRRDSRMTWPGGLGAITQRLGQVLEPAHRERMLLEATTVSVEQQKNEMHVRYFHQARVKTVAAKAVIMAAPKFIARHLVAGLPAKQAEAMQKIRYIPYPVVNLIFARPVFNRAYDTWCPGNTFTDCIVADWTVRDRPGYRQKNNILTFYTPLREGERAVLLTEEGSRRIATKVLRDFGRLFPGSAVDPIEVQLYRRGHPMYMSAPGNFTQVLPVASHPMERVFFANADSEGPISGTSDAIAAARRAVKHVERLLDGHRRARATAADVTVAIPRPA